MKTPLYDFAGLSGKRVAVLEGSQSDFIVSGENTDYGVVENATVVRFKNAASALMELKNGGVNAVLIDTIMARFTADRMMILFIRKWMERKRIQCIVLKKEMRTFKYSK